MIALITGQNKDKETFVRSLDLYTKSPSINKVILVTWSETFCEFPNHALKDNKCTIIKLPSETYRHNVRYQKKLYEKGVEYIKEKFQNKNPRVLKTRPDVFISQNQLDFISDQNYAIKSSNKNLRISHKIWVPWACVTKPFYIEDIAFCSPLDTMRLLMKDDSDSILGLGQGHAHIRYYFDIARDYNIYQKDYSPYRKLHTAAIDKNNKHIIETLKDYNRCINECFIIKSLPGGIEFNKCRPYISAKPSEGWGKILFENSTFSLRKAYSNKEFNEAHKTLNE